MELPALQDSAACLLQAEDGIRDIGVTGVQTCALPISLYAIGMTSLSRGGARSCRGAAATAGTAGPGGGNDVLIGGSVIGMMVDWESVLDGKSGELGGCRII